MTALDINRLSKQYRGKRGAQVDALRDLTLQIGNGEVFGFLGPNGAGKSTTIKCLMGLIRPTSGSVYVLGEAVGSVASRRLVGFLPETPAYFDYLTAEEYLHFVGTAFDMPKELLANRLEESLKLLDLWEVRKRPIRTYSKGMTQRVGLAQTLVHDPHVYILDEPMSGLDPIGRSLVKKIIRDLKRAGKSVFFSTHITSDVEEVCDRVGVIVGGELKAVEFIDRLLTEGITEYRVKVKRPDYSVAEITVDKAEVSAFVDSLAGRGEVLVLIEPKRRNLEEFFLAMVGGNGCR